MSIPAATVLPREVFHRALAVGYQRVTNQHTATFSLTDAFTHSGEKTVGVGVGIGW
ncbi:hypothetical protein ACTUVK_002888 [Stenotrophomonas rhizophila]